MLTTKHFINFNVFLKADPIQPSHFLLVILVPSDRTSSVDIYSYEPSQPCVAVKALSRYKGILTNRLCTCFCMSVLLWLVLPQIIADNN